MTAIYKQHNKAN